MRFNLLYALATLSALTACAAGSYPDTTLNNYDLQDIKKDSAFHAAIQGGKSIVIMSGANLRKKYPDKESIDANSAARTSAKTGSYKTALTAFVQWIDLEDSKNIITAGHLNLPDELKNSGPQIDLVAGSTSYQIFIVDPGTYGVTHTGYQLPRTLPPASSRRPHKKSTVGAVDFKQVINTEMEATQVWQDAVYGTRTEEYQECVAAHVTGGCVEVRYYTGNVDYVIKPAGYYEQLSPVEVIGSEVLTTFSNPFATFSVSPGEVILIDGLFAEPPNLRFDLDSCKGSDNHAITCELSQASLKLAPAQLDDIKTVKFIENGYPKLSAILSNIKHRTPTINAYKSSKDSDETVQYTISTD